MHVRKRMLTSLATIFVLLAPALAGRSRQPQFKKTIRLRVDGSESIDGVIRRGEKQRYQVIVEEPGGILRVDHIKRDADFCAKFREANGTSLEFLFEDRYEKAIKPGEYVLELTAIGGGGPGSNQFHYLFRLSLANRPAGN